jgi:thiol-disulfide isomerase/thioredoxin
MHKTITLGLIGIACISIGACKSQQTTEATPTTPVEQPTVVETVEVTQIQQEEPDTLSIGDAAPSINVDKWVKGTAVNNFEEGKIYVMEFWATWCPPCRKSIPHLTKLQEEYKDNNVNIIGCAIWQQEDTQDARDATVSTFVEGQGDDMDYTIAVDDGTWMSDNWMKPAGRNGIPAAFIIDGTGTVAWIGSPFSMDEALEQIVNGTWDLAAATESYAKELAQKTAMNELKATYRKAMENNNWDEWISAIDTFTAKYGDNDNLSKEKFHALLTGKKDKEAAYAWAETMVKADWDNSTALNSLAWNIVDEQPAELRNLDFALRVAQRGCELTDYKDPMILDTLARCYWEMGDKYKAIAWQEKAVEYMGDDAMNESILATLNEYKATLANVDE